MDNLYKETTQILKNHFKTWDDVLWVGGFDYYIPLEKVPTLFDVNYDGGYGSQEIAADLTVAGDNWWLERREYDGAEWWEYKEPPVKPNKELPKQCGVKINSVFEETLGGDYGVYD